MFFLWMIEGQNEMMKRWLELGSGLMYWQGS